MNNELLGKMVFCPYCGNTYAGEFGILSDTRLQGSKMEYQNYNAVCSCGAQGPDAESPEYAVERWNERRAVST